MAPSSASDSLLEVDASDVPVEFGRELLEIFALTDGTLMIMSYWLSCAASC